MKLVSLFLAAMIGAPAAPAVAQDDPPPDPQEAFVAATLDADGQAVVAGINRFGLDLYAELRGGGGDLAISPASISTAFGLAHAGARGATAAELAAVLHYPPAGDLHAAFGGVLKTMNLRRNGRTLAVNNALWLQQGLKLKPDYLSLVERHYGAGLQWVDYRGDREGARQRINRWVENKTNDRIRGLLQPSNLNRDTRSILVNTVYFKSDWAVPFDAKATMEGDFTIATGPATKRRLMHGQLDVAYAEGSGAKAVALPYRGFETEMVLLLPDRADGLAALERGLTADALDGWLAKLDHGREDVQVTLPRFKVEKRFELVEPLGKLGMRIAFSNASDFSGMKFVDPASRDREDWNFKIDDVVHQLFVEVEEKGTEAAAATAITQVIVTSARIPRPPKIFRADHPFLFLIRDRRTGAILFLGRYTGEGA